MALKYNKKLKAPARLLRKNATKEERHLWYGFLRTYPIPVVRQKVLGQYIVDFYCAQVQLVIEVDGSQHYEEEGLQQDAERTAYLRDAFGLDVVRILNIEVNRNFVGVCDYIDEEIRKRLIEG